MLSLHTMNPHGEDAIPPSYGGPHELRLTGVAAGLKMRVHSGTDVHVSRAIAEEGEWEPLETRFLMAMLAPGQVFVDVGANIGYFTVLGSRLVGEHGAVLAFEPEAENFRLLEANCRLNQCGNVRPFAMALGSESGAGTIYLDELNKGDHSIVPGQAGRAGQDIRIVNGSQALGTDYPRIDFVKIDTQGYECQVIEGLLPLLQASLPGLVMIIEFSPLHLLNAGASGNQLLELLGQLSSGHFYVLNEHSDGLLPLERSELAALASLVERDPGTQGYANVVFSGRPLERVEGLQVVRDWGMFDSALAYLLLASRLQPWNGRACLPADFDRYLYLSEGWSLAEDWGRWSLGTVSRLKFIIAPSLSRSQARVLRLRGRYFGPAESTGVVLDGQYLGDFDLTEASIELPVGCLQKEYVTLELQHAHPVSPAELGVGEDQRLIKYGLEELQLGSVVAG